MTLLDSFEESINVLKSNRMRTALSTLGIVIGIGSVISLVTLGQASQQSVKSRIQSLGANLLTIRPGAQQQGFMSRGSNDSTTLTYSDAVALQNSNRVTTVNSVAADYSARAQVSYESNNTNVQIVGAAGDYFKLRNISLAAGSEMTDQQNQTT
jgi:putative ABC transport system permease protein